MEVFLDESPEPPAATTLHFSDPNDLWLFDAHVHYSQAAWSAYSPGEVLALLARAGVRRALVSSTPDEGTLRLHERAPEAVAPMLRPYRSSGDVATWTSDASVVPYLEERLRRGIYHGLGELHLSAEQATSRVAREVARLAVRDGIYLQVHGDERAVEELYRLDPRLRVLWAHAGMSATARSAARLLERYPSLVVELALRSDVAPGGALDADWRDVFVRYADRFLVGTDTWVNSQWERYEEIQAFERSWLTQLPREVAALIAHGNGERLFPRRP